MEFTARFGAQDLEDLAVLVRPRFYWPRLLLANVQGAAIGVMLLWIGVRGLFGQLDLPWWGTAAVWAVLIGGCGWGYHSAVREQRKTLASLNANLPDRTTFAADGVRWTGPDAASGFLPWSRFVGFRERGGVLSLDEPKRRVGVFVSVRNLNDIERQQLRDFLASHILLSHGHD